MCVPCFACLVFFPVGLIFWSFVSATAVVVNRRSFVSFDLVCWFRFFFLVSFFYSRPHSWTSLVRLFPVLPLVSSRDKCFEHSS